MKILTLIFLLMPAMIFAQESELKGKVFDSESGQILPYASILLGGTNKGTVTNIEGIFTFKLVNGRHNLIIRYVGYRTDTLNVSAPQNNDISIRLKKQPVLLPEVLVTSEDPAYRIIREAIRRKRINKKGLENYEYNAYSKNVMESAGEIAMVQETIIKGFKLKDNSEKEFIIETHKTENQKKSYNINLTADLTNKHLPDFSADTLRLMMNKIYLPIADNAFDYYDYKLLKTIDTKSAPIYEISVIPQSSIQPLLEGTIYIEGENYSIIKVDLKASEGVRFPYVQNLKMEFSQSLGKYDGYWLPDYFEMNASMGFNLGGIIGVEPLSFHEVGSITEYRINLPVPDSVINAVRSNFGGFVSDTSQRKIPPKELTSEEIKALRPVPLTKSEITALATIDTSMTIEKSLKFTGALAGLASANTNSNRNSSESLFGKISRALINYGYINNNRVEYITLGVKYNSGLFGNKLYSNSFGAYSIGMKNAVGSISLGYRLSNFFLTRIEAEVYKKVNLWQPINPFVPIINSVSVLLGFEDQFNYYLSAGYRIGLIKNIAKNFTASLNFISEKESSLKHDKYFSIFNQLRSVRINPQINEGIDRKLQLYFLIGKSPFELQLIPDDGLLTNVELSSNLLKSDFNYFKTLIAGQLKLKTFYKELFLSPFIQINIEAEYLKGEYGIQQILSPVSSMGFYSPVTSFKGLKPYQFAGDKMIALHIEHNWRTIIFQALGLNFLTNLDLDIVTGAAALRIWNDTKYMTQLSQSKPYWELYAGISRILAIIKLEISYNSLKKYTATLSTAVVF